MEKQLIFEGFYFETIEELNEAKKEAEAISYIRAKTDLNNIKVVYNLYQKLLEKNSLKTPIGFEFLRSLQKKLEQVGGKVEIAPLPIKAFSMANNKDEKVKSFAGRKTKEFKEGSEKRMKDKVAFYEQKLKNARLVQVFFIIIIIVMFAITMRNNNMVFLDEELALQDKYGAWEDELKAREDAVVAKEKELGIENNN